jgi:tetratricopeptide (TPR) repeat protein
LAIRDFTEAIQWKPDYFDALLARGKLYDNVADYPKAIGDLEAAVKINAQSGEAFFALGLALDHGDRMPEAQVAFQKAVDPDPTYLARLDSHHIQGKPVIEGVLLPGQAYCSKGRVCLADSDAARRAGDTKRADELLDLAVGYLRAASGEDPTNADTCYWLGEAYARKGQTDQAKECFGQATKLNDGHFPSYLAWGKLLCDRGDDGDYATAAEFLRRALSLCGQSAEARLLLAKACLGITDESGDSKSRNSTRRRQIPC